METFRENLPSIKERAVCILYPLNIAAFSFTVRITIKCIQEEKKCCQLNYNHTTGRTMKLDIRDNVNGRSMS